MPRLMSTIWKIIGYFVVCTILVISAAWFHQAFRIFLEKVQIVDRHSLCSRNVEEAILHVQRKQFERAQRDMLGKFLFSPCKNTCEFVIFVVRSTISHFLSFSLL